MVAMTRFADRRMAIPGYINKGLSCYSCLHVVLMILFFYKLSCWRAEETLILSAVVSEALESSSLEV